MANTLIITFTAISTEPTRSGDVTQSDGTVTTWEHYNVTMNEGEYYYGSTNFSTFDKWENGIITALKAGAKPKVKCQEVLCRYNNREFYKIVPDGEKGLQMLQKQGLEIVQQKESIKVQQV